MEKIRKYKKEDLVSFTLGMTLTLEALLTKQKLIKKVFVHSKLEENKNTKKLFSLCEKNKIEVEKNDKVFNVLSQKGNCFVIGVFEKFESKLRNGDHIVLVNPSDSGNVGTIIRTAVGFGFENLAIIRPAVDIFDPKTVRASMGAVFHINIEYFDSIDDYKKRFNKQNLFAFMLNSSKSILDTKFVSPFSLVFGNEASGLEKEYANFCKTVIIPQTKNVDSLNLTTAVSIGCFVAKNQK